MKVPMSMIAALCMASLLAVACSNSAKNVTPDNGGVGDGDTLSTDAENALPDTGVDAGPDIGPDADPDAVIGEDDDLFAGDDIGADDIAETDDIPSDADSGAADDGTTPDDDALLSDETTPDADADIDTDTVEPIIGRYLVSIDNRTDATRLLKVDIDTGEGTEVCVLPAPYNGYNYNSLTFNRAGYLFAHCRGVSGEVSQIHRIDPCTCEVTVLGDSGFSSIPGITADRVNGLFGIETTQDLFLTIDTATGAGTSIGPLGVDFGTSGATWSDEDDTVYGINGTDDSLYVIDPDDGVATFLIAITGVDLGTVGVELNPFDGVIYACTDDGILYAVDPITGIATAIGTGMGHQTSCSNLGAPWTEVTCLEEL
ncbi:MAG TPA: hypothetical protein PKH10_07720 [bacterium]|nr:hypothetical protein [bacterium]